MRNEKTESKYFDIVVVVITIGGSNLMFDNEPVS